MHRDDGPEHWRCLEMKKVFAILVAVSVIAVVVAGCGPKAEDTSTAPATKTTSGAAPAATTTTGTTATTGG